MFHFLVNPASRSGAGRAVWNEIEKELKRRGTEYEVIFSQSGNHVGEVMEQWTGPSEKIRDIVIVGGDGTMDQAVDHILDFEHIRLGYIPAGSGNDFARSLKHSDDPLKELETILEGKVRRNLDIGTLVYHNASDQIHIEGLADYKPVHRFDVSAGIGFDAAVCAEILTSGTKGILNKIGLGKLTYGLTGVKQILWAKKCGCRLILDDHRAILYDRFLFAAIMIHPYEGGGFMFGGPDADPEDGLFDICIPGDINSFRFLRILPTCFKGQMFRFKNVDHYRCRKIEIITKEPLWVHTDGEVVAKSSRISATIEKGILKMLN